MTGLDERITVKGLKEVSRALGKIDKEAAKQLRTVGNQAADLLITKTRPEIPRRTGAAQASLKAQSTRTAARVAVGGPRAPWYPWLDFGGQGRVHGRPAPRPFLPGGRYLFPTLGRISPQVTDLLQTGIVETARSAGLVVS